jgi:hypothetical protein
MLTGPNNNNNKNNNNKNNNNNNNNNNNKAWRDPEGSWKLKLPDFKTVGTWRWQGCQHYAPAAFTPREYSWYSFLLEAESTPWP